MPRSPNVDGWIQAAKLTTSAGEMAPFLFIKGAAGCVTIVLEAIEKAGKNDKDLRTLAEDIETTMSMVKDAIEAHGISGATHLYDVYAEFQTFLENLLAELDITKNNLERKRLKGLLKALKARKVADTINGFKQRMNTIKTDYSVGTGPCTDGSMSDSPVIRSSVLLRTHDSR
ncbi:hypothetical protein ARMGADRAFT_79427 [Armillaria gallica]|uniref:Uncharacterized protein n=1 Tax=Armillaria gallica TaxID=47427 RepID=A0A2H3CEQ1_ARMGA|nr:hypothetical protein ARMGADRAFT_79427 [Armillaria gallica]